MRVAYLTNEYPKTSHTFVRREIKQLEERGFVILRIALRGWTTNFPDIEDEKERLRTKFVLRTGFKLPILSFFRLLLVHPGRIYRATLLALQLGWRADRPLMVHLAYLAEACLVAVWLNQHKAKHLHAHFGTNSAFVAMLASILAGIPWSFTVHGPEEFDRPLALKLEQKVRWSRFVVAVSSFGKSQLLRWVKTEDRSKVHVIRCGLDRDFLDAPRARVDSRRRFVSVGRLAAQKGNHIALEALRLLDDRSIELVLAGDGELRQEIEMLIRKYKLESQVRITGWLSNAEISAEIIAARALLLPSLAEGLPVAIMEAMALRRPVISTYVAGIPELVTAECGWLVPAGDVGALAGAMSDCLSLSLERLSAMGDAAHARVSALHDLRRETQKLAELIIGPQPEVT